MSKNPHVVSGFVRVPVSPRRFWPFLSQSSRINEVAGLPARVFREEPDSRGGTRLFSVEKTPFGDMPYEEKPFDWVRPGWTMVERIFSKGTLKWVHIEFRTEPCRMEDGREGSDLAVTIRYENRNLLGVLASVPYFKMKVMPGVLKAFKTLGENLARSVVPMDPFSSGPPADEEAIRKLTARFLAVGAEGMASAVARWILTTGDQDLIRIRPYRLARQLGLEPKDLLRFMLKGVREGFFELGWNLICPVCRGPKENAATLSGLKAHGFCSSCRVDITAVLDESVELHFRPHPGIRPVSGTIFCSGGPGATPHVLAQVRVPVGGTRQVSLVVEPGLYRITSPQLPGSLLLRIEPGAPAEPVRVTGELAGERRVGAWNPLELELKNPDPGGEVLYRLEHTSWMEDVLTASEALSTQAFRDLFSSEVVRPGQEMAVRSVTLLFTDLKGSTRFYNTEGDPRAFAAVHEHFDILTAAVEEAGGAVVKTIGDAVMAVFMRPEDAVVAAVGMHRGMLRPGAPGTRGLSLKMGLHQGPALAVNLNDRLDYFGRTVNLAARTEGSCEGGDLVLGQEVFDIPEVRGALEKAGVDLGKAEVIRKHLKGFDEEIDLVRLPLTFVA